MRFELDHDWQGNMSTPRPRVGENAKTQLLLLLCAIWVLFGLIGHAPWKPLESTGISIIKGIIEGGSLIAPLAAGESSLTSPPLYYLTAAASAQLFSPVLSMHDGARLFNAVWITIILLMVGMTGRELWVRGVGRHATFIMIGTIGLVMNAHSLNAEVASMASAATGFYALALCKRRPWRASALLGMALATAFLSTGIITPLILLGTALLLPLLFSAWRTKSYAKVLVTAAIIATPLISGWLMLLYVQHPALFTQWLADSRDIFEFNNHFYFLRMQLWYAWPALPLALWGLWRNRDKLFSKPKFQLIIVFFACCLLLLGFGASSKDIHAMPLLLPLVALGAGSVEHLKRGAASALNWFGITLFGVIGFLIWLGWIAMATGHPAKIKERMLFLSGATSVDVQWFMLLPAILVTAIWLFTCVRSKQGNRSTVTNWAVGMTFGWSLLMTLWLPWIDSAKSYEPVFTSILKKLPGSTNCVNSLDVGQSQRMLFNYYTGINLKSVEANTQLECNYYLIQDERGVAKMQPGEEWKLVWQGKRAADRHESFRMFERR